jgi:uncharacterized iron-regulated membrane protein
VRRVRVRALWLWLHRWLGLTAGLALAVIGLTGALLVVDRPLWRLEFPEVVAPLAPSPGGMTPVADWIAAAKRARPDLGEPEFVAAPGAVPLPGDAAIVGREIDLGGGAHGHFIVAVDPWRAEPLGSFVLEETWAGLPILLHTSLLLPLVGPEVVAWAGVLAAVSAASGLYLFWPRRGRWRRALAPMRRAPASRRWLEAHNLLGFYLLPVLLVLALSGVYLLKEQWLDPVVSLASPVPPPPEPAPLRLDPASCGGPTTLPAAVAAAAAAAPGAVPRFASAPPHEDPAGAFRVWLARPGEANWRYGESEAWVDPGCPRVLALRDGRERTAGERFKLAMLPVHDGTYLGPAGEALVLLAGLLMPVLYVTGVAVWWRRRPARGAGLRDPSLPSTIARPGGLRSERWISPS